MEGPDTTEKEPVMHVTEDPIEYTKLFIESNTFKDEFKSYADQNPIPETVKSELPDQNEATLLNYQQYRFLASHGEELVHRFTAENNVRLRYRHYSFPENVRDDINAYLSQVKELNHKFSGLSLDERSRYSNLRSKYHDEAGDSVGTYLSDQGVLPKPPFSDSLPLQSFGRGITSMCLRSKFPQLDNLEHYT